MSNRDTTRLFSGRNSGLDRIHLGQAFKRVRLSAHVFKIRIVEVHVTAVRIPLPYLNDSVGLVVRQGTQEHAINYAKNGRARPDSQGEGSDGYRREPRIVLDLPQR